MGTRTVRLDEKAEHALQDVMRSTGLNVAEALRKGLFLLRDQVRGQESSRPFAIYETLPLGPGDESIPPARRAKQAVAEALRKKRR